MSGARVLIVDDDPAILRAVRRSLESHEYTVRTAETGAGALSEAVHFRPEVVLLDLVLPDMDGIAVCSAIRRESTVPVIVLSAVGDDARKVEALDRGADDYITKPFSMNEVEARIRVALRRRVQVQEGSAIEAGGIRLDVARHTVEVAGSEVRMTPTEYQLLQLLVSQRGRVLTQRHILAEVWGAEYVDDSHILRTFVHQLRHKLGPAGRQIVTDPGVGYRFEEA